MTPTMNNKFYRSSFNDYDFTVKKKARYSAHRLFIFSFVGYIAHFLFKIMMAPHNKICDFFYHFLFTSIIRLPFYHLS